MEVLVFLIQVNLREWLIRALRMGNIIRNWREGKLGSLSTEARTVELVSTGMVSVRQSVSYQVGS